MHELVEVRVGTVGYIDATGSDLAIDSYELSANDVVPREQGVLLGPGLGGVGSTGFEGIKSREDTINIEIALFAVNGV